MSSLKNLTSLPLNRIDINNKPKNGMHLYVVIESSKAGFLPFLLNFNKIILPQLQAYLEKLCENIKPFLNDYYLQPLDYKGFFFFLNHLG